jgi:hypothetical protein
MVIVNLDLDTDKVGLPLILANIFMGIIIGIKIFRLGESMSFPLYYYFVAVSFFVLITTLVFEVLFDISELVTLVVFGATIFILPELPLPGEFNFLLVVVAISLYGNLVTGLFRL